MVFYMTINPVWRFRGWCDRVVWSRALVPGAEGIHVLWVVISGQKLIQPTKTSRKAFLRSRTYCIWRHGSIAYVDRDVRDELHKHWKTKRRKTICSDSDSNWSFQNSERAASKTCGSRPLHSIALSPQYPRKEQYWLERAGVGRTWGTRERGRAGNPFTRRPLPGAAHQ